MVIRNGVASTLVFLVSLSAQELVTPPSSERIHEIGSITYISADMIYTDLGKNSGAGMGDTLEVKRKTETIGFVQITHISRKSSVGKAIWTKGAFQVGDRVVLEKTVARAERENLPPPGVKKEGRPSREVVTPREVPTRAAPGTGAKITHRGKIALRGTLFKSQVSGEAVHREKRTIGIAHYSLSVYGHYPLSFSFYGRSSSQPSNGGIDYSLYHAKIEVTSPEGNYSGQIGRIYTSYLSGIGSLDGMLAQAAINYSLSGGLVAGMQPDPQTTKTSTRNLRMGAYLRWNYRQKPFILSGNIAGVGQYQDSKVDREFLYLQNRMRIGRWGTFFLAGELDIDRKNISQTRGFAQLSSLNGSLRIRPSQWLTFSSRFLSRRNVKYFRTHASIPDSLFNDQLRTGWFNSAYITFPGSYSFQIGHSYRTEESARKASQMVSFAAAARNLTPRRLNLRGRLSLLDNVQVRAYRAQVSAGTTVQSILNLYVEYEWYQYRFGGASDPNRRHTLSSEITLNLRRTLYSTLLVERSWETDWVYTNAFAEISYRF